MNPSITDGYDFPTIRLRNEAASLGRAINDPDELRILGPHRLAAAAVARRHGALLSELDLDVNDCLTIAETGRAPEGRFISDRHRFVASLVAAFWTDTKADYAAKTDAELRACVEQRLAEIAGQFAQRAA